MNRNRLSAIVLILLFTVSCKHKQDRARNYSHYVQKDTANVMIESYLQSIAPDTGEQSAPDLHSLIMDAEALREYLNNTEIKSVKFMFAHTLEYIDSGHQGQNAGYKSGALTLIVAGYDTNGNYIFSHGDRVPNHCTPCPEFCGKKGAAAGDLLH